MQIQAETNTQSDQDSENRYKERILELREKIGKGDLKRKDWTIMVYLAGDNNLAEEMVYSLKSMYSIGSTPECEVFAFYEGLRPAKFNIPTRDKRRTILQGLPIQDPMVQDRMLLEGPVTENHELLRQAEGGFKESVASVRSTLEEFITESIISAPAEHYMLVLSGHGTGNVGDFLSACKRPSGLSIPDLSETLWNVEDLFAEYGAADLYRKMDILGLDSCQMSTAELAYQIAGHVDYLVGSEGFQPNTGWPYDRMLAQLYRRCVEESALRAYEKARDLGRGEKECIDAAREQIMERAGKLSDFSADSSVLNLLRGAEEARKRNPDKACLPSEKFPTPINLAAGIVREHIKFYSSDYSLADVSTDLSALNLRHLARVTEPLKKLATLLKDRLNELRDQKTKIDPLIDAITLAHWEAQGYKDEQNVDLWDFCNALQERLKSNDNRLDKSPAGDIEKACGSIKTAIENGDPLQRLAVLSGYCGPAFQHSHGLSVYFPWTLFTDAAGVDDLLHYQTLDFAAGTGWHEFLYAYVKATQRSIREIAGSDQHKSALNRCDYLFTGAPESLLKQAPELLILTGSGASTPETLQMSNGRMIIETGATGSITAGEITLRGELTSEHGELRINGVTHEIPEDEELTVRYDRIKDHGGELTVSGNEIRTRDGRVTVRDGRVTVRDGRVTVRDGRVTVRDGRVMVREGQVTVSSGETFEIRDGRVTVRDGRVTVRGGDAIEVRDGRVTVRDGRVTVRDGRVTVRDGRVTVRDGRVTVRDGRVTVRDGRVTVRGGDAIEVRDGRVTVRDGRVTVRDGFMIRDGGVTVRDPNAFGGGTIRNPGNSARGGAAGWLVKIASMKNPPFDWNDCELIVEEKPMI